MSAKPLLTLWLLLSTVAISATAQAGTGIWDKRDWPGQVAPSVYNAGRPENELSYALATGRATPGPQAGTKVDSGTVGPAPISDGKCVWRYQGGPKYPMTCTRKKIMRAARR